MAGSRPPQRTALGTLSRWGLVGFPPGDLPPEAAAAGESVAGDELRGVVWLDFALGGGGEEGAIDRDERGLPGIEVQAVQEGTVVASVQTGQDGTFAFADLPEGGYTLVLPRSNFREPFNGSTGWAQRYSRRRSSVPTCGSGRVSPWC